MRVGRLRISREAAIAAGATALFIGLSVWWLLYDQRVPGFGDPGRHMTTALGFADLLREGDLGGLIQLGPVGEENELFYPPLVHAVGGIPAALDLAVESWGTIALNLVFVPLLAAGCYWVGCLTYGRRAGMLAAIFALGTPAVLSLFHVFLLDAPLAATTAIALAALLASERFSRSRESMLAGALVGLSLLVKTTAPLYLLGPVAVMVIAGGWRQWRNLGLAAAALLIVAGPYYLIHLEDVVNVTESSTVGQDVGRTGAGFTDDPRLSFENLTYYVWDAANIQYFVPLLALFGAGLIAAVREIRTRRHLPELLAGLAFGYLIPTLAFSFRDPRYTVPLVVYVAVIGVGWLTTTPRPVLRRAGLAVLAVGVVLNVGASLTTRLPELELKIGEEFPVHDGGTFTLVDDRGFIVGPPLPDPFWHDLLEEAERDGLRTARLFLHEVPFWGMDTAGFDVLAREHGVRETSIILATATRAELRINVWYTDDEFFVEERGFPEPCGTVEEGTGAPADSDPVAVSVAVERLQPDRTYARWCDF